jgi:hypothetical protein
VTAILGVMLALNINAASPKLLLKPGRCCCLSATFSCISADRQCTAIANDYDFLAYACHFTLFLT